MDKYTLQTLGFGLIVLGFFLFIITLLFGSGSTSCPAYGCSPSALQWELVGVFAFFSGIALVSMGIILVIVARSMKPEQAKGKWADVRVAGRKESRFWIPERHIMTFEEAKALPDAYVVMEGDYGGQCYLTASMRTLACQEKELRQLLDDLGELFWQDVEGRHLYYERHRTGDRIDSGMGGGLIFDNVWIHKQLIEFGLETKIRELLSGKVSRLELADDNVRELRGRWLSSEERSKYLDY